VVGAVLGAVDPDRYLLVTAHYDHLGLRNGTLYPGADDNASGVAAMLAAAGYFRAHRPRHSLLFVAFDGEERGLRGASAFLEQPPVALDAMLVDVNFDMLSRSPAGEVFLSGLYANPQLRPLVDPVRARAAPAMLYGHDAPRPFWNGDDWTDQSDHGAFNDRHIPFLYVGVEDHPDYHRPTDTADRIDQDFYVGVADAVVDLIDALDAASPAQLARRHQAVSGE
jgi:Zn-dependent M28 family amino/carboxypeptidase